MNMTRSLFFIFMSLLFFSAIPFSFLKIDELPSVIPHPSDSFWELQDQRVEIRGFWYPDPNGQTGILSPRPDLKSCCVRNPLMMTQQIIVNGDSAELINVEAGRAITLQGIFKINPLYNEEGRLLQVYVLDQAHYIPSSTSLYLIWIPIVMIGGIYLFRKLLLRT